MSGYDHSKEETNEVNSGKVSDDLVNHFLHYTYQKWNSRALQGISPALYESTERTPFEKWLAFRYKKNGKKFREGFEVHSPDHDEYLVNVFDIGFLTNKRFYISLPGSGAYHYINHVVGIEDIKDYKVERRVTSVDMFIHLKSGKVIEFKRLKLVPSAKAVNFVIKSAKLHTKSVARRKYERYTPTLSLSTIKHDKITLNTSRRLIASILALFLGAPLGGVTGVIISEVIFGGSEYGSIGYFVGIGIMYATYLRAVNYFKSRQLLSCIEERIISYEEQAKNNPSDINSRIALVALLGNKLNKWNEAIHWSREIAQIDTNGRYLLVQCLRQLKDTQNEASGVLKELAKDSGLVVCKNSGKPSCDDLIPQPTAKLTGGLCRSCYFIAKETKEINDSAV